MPEFFDKLDQFGEKLLNIHLSPAVDVALRAEKIEEEIPVEPVEIETESELIDRRKIRIDREKEDDLDENSFDPGMVVELEPVERKIIKDSRGWVKRTFFPQKESQQNVNKSIMSKRQFLKGVGSLATLIGLGVWGVPQAINKGKEIYKDKIEPAIAPNSPEVVNTRQQREMMVIGVLGGTSETRVLGKRIANSAIAKNSKGEVVEIDNSSTWEGLGFTSDFYKYLSDLDYVVTMLEAVAGRELLKRELLQSSGDQAGVISTLVNEKGAVGILQTAKGLVDAVTNQKEVAGVVQTAGGLIETAKGIIPVGSTQETESTVPTPVPTEVARSEQNTKAVDLLERLEVYLTANPGKVDLSKLKTVMITFAGGNIDDYTLVEAMVSAFRQRKGGIDSPEGITRKFSFNPEFYNGLSYIVKSYNKQETSQ